MELKVNSIELVNYLLYWYDKTDDECIEIATNENGVDAEQALTNMLERDICTEITNIMVEELRNNTK